MTILTIIIQQQCLDIFRSPRIILEFLFLLCLFTLFIIVAFFESELASETFVFFTLYLYIPTQILNIYFIFKFI